MKKTVPETFERMEKRKVMGEGEIFVEILSYGSNIMTKLLMKLFRV